MNETLKCEPCQVNEIDAEAEYTVSNEPWCKSCYELHASSCERCMAIIDGDDAYHGDDNESCCYDCGQYDATE